MGWKDDLHRLDQSFPRAELADRLGLSQRKIGMALSGASDLSVYERWRVREEMERLRAEHSIAQEVAVYALQMAYQLRDAPKERRDKILERCVPILEHKIEGLTDDAVSGDMHDLDPNGKIS